MKNFCPYCNLSKSAHALSLADYYLEKILWNFSVALGSFVLRWIKNGESQIMKLFFKPLAALGIVKFLEYPEEKNFCNRSLIFFKEAQRRALKVKSIKILWRHTLAFELEFLGKKHYYIGTPLNRKPQNHIIDDKIAIKKILEKNNIPVARGKIFTSRRRAMSYGREIDFPLVVKPNNSSLSRHVTCNINTEIELIRGIKIAKMLKPDFVLEKYVSGRLYRATVIGRKKVFICEKELANVVGDGTSTINELIIKKNNDPRRGTALEIYYTLHKIPLDKELEYNLQENNLNLSSILPSGEKIILQKKNILSHGCDIINNTQETHEENKKMFLKIAELLGADIIGIDFICPDITKSYKEQITAVLETNSMPYIDMHQNPSHGNPEPVAELAWDMVLEELSQSQ